MNWKIDRGQFVMACVGWFFFLYKKVYAFILLTSIVCQLTLQLQLSPRCTSLNLKCFFFCKHSPDTVIALLTNVWFAVSAGGALRPAGDRRLQPAAGGAAGNPSVLQPTSADPSRPKPEPLPAAATTNSTGTNWYSVITLAGCVVSCVGQFSKTLSCMLEVNTVMC